METVNPRFDEPGDLDVSGTQEHRADDPCESGADHPGSPDDGEGHRRAALSKGVRCQRGEERNRRSETDPEHRAAQDSLDTIALGDFVEAILDGEEGGIGDQIGHGGSAISHTYYRQFFE